MKAAVSTGVFQHRASAENVGGLWEQEGMWRSSNTRRSNSHNSALFPSLRLFLHYSLSISIKFSVLYWHTLTVILREVWSKTRLHSLLNSVSNHHRLGDASNNIRPSLGNPMDLVHILRRPWLCQRSGRHSYLSPGKVWPAKQKCKVNWSTYRPEKGDLRQCPNTTSNHHWWRCTVMHWRFHMLHKQSKLHRKRHQVLS